MSDRSEKKVGIIGIGYVGLPLVAAFCEKEINCIGFDIDEEKVNSLNNSISFLDHPSNQDIESFIKNGLFQATTDFTKISEVNHVIICVPTPIDLYRKPDLNYVIESVESIVEYLAPSTLISLESTTYPGTTRDIIAPILEKSNLSVGKDVYLSFSPEREDPGNKKFNLSNTPKVVSGYTEECLKRSVRLYSSM